MQLYKVKKFLLKLVLPSLSIINIKPGKGDEKFFFSFYMFILHLIVHCRCLLLVLHMSGFHASLRENDGYQKKIRKKKKITKTVREI